MNKKKKFNHLFSFVDPGWTGIDCSIDIDECKTIQPCRAAKTCINLPGSYKCECLDSFTGHNCEMVCMIYVLVIHSMIFIQYRDDNFIFSFRLIIS